LQVKKCMDETRVGVVGTGHLGNYHLQKYKKLSSVEIAGVADIVEERAKRAGSFYGCAAFSDYRRLIGRVDAVSIAVPTASHYHVAKDFLEAGVHVLLEKPTAATVAEARELNALARRRDLVLQIGFVERFNPAILALEKVLDRPIFIEAHRLHPFFTRGTDVDVILDLMIHDLDIILKFVKSPLDDVAAVGVSVLSDRVDIANARLTFRSGCVANVTASRVTGKTMQKIRFFGLNCYHAVDYAKRELISLSKKTNGGDYADIVQNPVDIKLHDPLEEEIRSFLEAVANRTAPLVSGEDALPSLDAAHRIIEKIKTSPVMMP
jgi:predicted dehydrogenase